MLIESADALVRLQQQVTVGERCFDDAKAFQQRAKIAEARVDRLTVELQELRDAVASTLTEPHAIVALARAHRQDSENADECIASRDEDIASWAAKVDRLTVALREIEQVAMGPYASEIARKALAPADQEPPHE